MSPDLDRTTRLADAEAAVVLVDEVATDFHLIRLHLPKVARGALPGQFVQLEADPGVTPLLRVPLSVCAADANAGTFDVLFENMGPKTLLLSRARVGDILRCIGPIGNAFPRTSKSPVLVGGGIGVPPLLFLGSVMATEGTESSLLVGARTGNKHLPPSMLAAAATQHKMATDDGSVGHRGFVTELLQSELDARPQSTVYTCGPYAMMMAVAATCRAREVECYASLEEYMACGFGVCVGCVVARAARHSCAPASPYQLYSRICVDGPVYEVTEIDWGQEAGSLHA